VRINILVPFIGRTGGIAVALEHARGLRALGHAVEVLYPLLPYREFLHGAGSALGNQILGRLKPFLGNLLRYRTEVSWAGPGSPVRPVPWFSDRTVPDADVTLASAWPTAYTAARLSARKGAKAYLIQHYEIWSGDRAKVDGSYRLPVELITIAPWLTALMSSRFSRQVLAEVHNGMDFGFFSPPPARDWSSPAVLMMHHELEWKGAREGLEALTAVRARHPEITVRIFGLGPFPDRPSWIEYHRNPSHEALRELYRKSTIFVSPSHEEGWGLPAMEALACGCALVATRTGFVPLLDDGASLVPVAPKDARALEDAVETLVADPARARSLGGKGHAAVTRLTWEASTRSLEQALLRCAGRGRIEAA
jgi:glycosyltransferase involved in cell wall biosynthesis